MDPDLQNLEHVDSDSGFSHSQSWYEELNLGRENDRKWIREGGGGGYIFKSTIWIRSSMTMRRERDSCLCLLHGNFIKNLSLLIIKKLSVPRCFLAIGEKGGFPAIL
jgi:hypothetical protein